MMRLRHNVLRVMAAALMATGGGSTLARQSEAGPTITVHGGAGDVAGSLAILEFDGSRWMIDCGMFYPSGPGSAEEREERARFGNASLPVEPGEIEAVFLTHAHLDHIGRTPLLV
jgi:metallo-beta-lactamase family protein